MAWTFILVIGNKVLFIKTAYDALTVGGAYLFDGERRIFLIMGVVVIRSISEGRLAVGLSHGS
jgi:hypothetical protein